MPDTGSARTFAREIFGVVVRALGLGMTIWFGFMGISALVTDAGSLLLPGVAGFAAGWWMLRRADRVCDFAYGPRELDASGS